MNYYDPTLDEPFDGRNIPLPKTLETDEDFAQLFQHMISEFHTSLNVYRKKYGYGDRQRLLASILMALKEAMPIVNPEYIENYPRSLDDIKGLVAQMILMSREFTGKHPEEVTA